MLSCPERHATLTATLASCGAGGWSRPEVVLDDQTGPTSMERLNWAWWRVLLRAGQSRADFVLLLEDDLIFGRWFAENLRSWPQLGQRPANGAFWGSLYNHGSGLQRAADERTAIAEPQFVWGSQAVVLTPLTARFLSASWHLFPGNADVRMPRMASLVTPLYYHRPSLVDHVQGPSTWGTQPHRSIDFDPEWRAG